MKFRTELTLSPAPRLLDPERSLVLIGSCFTDNIGARMRACLWRAFPNETGVLFNPASIAKVLRLAVAKDNYFDTIDGSLIERDRLWMTWLGDSKYSRYSKEDTKDILISRLYSLRRELGQAQALIVTFGTAWLYELRERPGYVVANCHKFPADMFVRRRLSVDEIVAEWRGILNLLKEKYPELRVIFTVSPVRHLKDGFEGNSRSKAILQLACEQLCEEFGEAEYFPAYEIMLDDLRDYRFYAPDMVHPSDTAVDYIWEKFQESYLSEESRQLLKEGEKVNKRLNHRPVMHGNSELAQYLASEERYKADMAYNEFIQAHPDMLYVDQ